MTDTVRLPLPVLDALLLGAHRLVMLTDQALFDACGVRVAFTQRADGASEGPYGTLNLGSHVGDDPAAVAENRRLACEAVGADPSRLLHLNQIHSTRVVQITEEPFVEADGFVMDEADVPTMLFSADCLLVAVVSPSGRFACAHAGWRGAVGHIAAKAVDALAADDPYPPSEYNAYLGPHIRCECFEVSEEVADRFRAEFGEEAVPEYRHVSLASAVSLDLQRAGLAPERIVDSGICTMCHPDQYYSYRASNGTCGCQAALVVKMSSREQLSS